MAVQTIYLLGTTAVTPNWWGNTQLNGTAPTGANSAYGWAPAKIAVTTPYIRGRLGATTTSTDAAIAASYNAATSGPAKGTGSGATTAGDSFIAGPFSGKFAATAWTFNFNLRASTAGAVGHVNLRVWRSRNADGSAATQLLANTVGATVTLSTTVDTNSSVSWSPGAVSLDNEYLFLQVEWQETIAGTSNSDNVLFRIGTALVTTPDFVAAATGPGTLPAGASAVSVVAGGVTETTGTGAPAAQAAGVAGAAVGSSSGSGALPAGASAAAGVGVSLSPMGVRSLLAPWQGGAALITLNAFGNLFAQVSRLAGTGLSVSTGTGALATTRSTLAGSGLVSAGGTGTLVVTSVATLAGSGSIASVGGGDLIAASSALAGSGLTRTTGTGALAAEPSFLEGTGPSSSSIGAGALAASPSLLSGSGVQFASGTSVLIAQNSAIAGTGAVTTAVAIVMGTGALIASSSTLAGTDQIGGFAGSGFPALRRISMPLGMGV